MLLFGEDVCGGLLGQKIVPASKVPVQIFVPAKRKLEQNRNELDTLEREGQIERIVWQLVRLSNRINSTGVFSLTAGDNATLNLQNE